MDTVELANRITKVVEDMVEGFKSDLTRPQLYALIGEFFTKKAKAINCDSCGKREAEYKSLGGIEFCHECAHDIGLIHYHEGIDNYPHEHK